MSVDMNKKSNQTLAILAVIVLVIIAWNLGNKQALNSALVSSVSSTTPSLIDKLFSTENTKNTNAKGNNLKEKIASVSEGNDSIKVRDQQAGSEVRVSSLVLSEIGWVGVRDNEGRVLGAGRFEAGSFENVTIPLLRATVSGDSYQVLIYVDDGDKEFDLHKDILVTGSNGGVAGTNFKAL